MSAFSRLWRRAPLWRLSLVSMVAFSGVTALYPPDWLVGLYPPLGRFAHHPAATPDDDASSSDSSRNETGQNSQAAGGGGHGNGYGTEQASVPPIDAQLIDLMPFAGRQLPLPAGIWHPVLTETTGPHGEISSNILVRTDRGVVTGVILVQATTASVPPSVLSDQPCHARDAYFQRTLAAPKDAVQCISTNVSLTPKGDIRSRDDIDWAFGRLQLLGFPMPPVWALASWTYAVNAPDGGKNFENVTMALSPADPGTARISTSLSDWTPDGLGTSPFSGRFMQDVNGWLTQWAPVLLQGYQGTLQPSPEKIRPAASDPAWHGTAGAPPT
ncbi:MAG: hypothetical protein ABF876_14810 [Acetobacter aceti]|uniref:Uncharacterized protein n=1 Tax=Acetobacter aceti TaxID=435 RepID=A0A1U9KGW8_ACEAC|nr:hypothetical protein [Acetobacter aceti]AQS85030.1 hypothetical protein A0U92_09860 [Acetobacter aceti]